MADSLEVSTLLGGILVAVSCLKSLLAVARSVNHFVAFFYLSRAVQCERFIVFIPISNVCGKCEQVKRIDMKTDKNKYGAM